jgi:hypothetical protein
MAGSEQVMATKLRLLNAQHQQYRFYSMVEFPFWGVEPTHEAGVVAMHWELLFNKGKQNSIVSEIRLRQCRQEQ